MSPIKPSYRSIILVLGTGTTLVGGLLILIMLKVAGDIPSFQSIADYEPPGITQFIAHDGGRDEVVAEFYKERRYVVPYEKIPEQLVNAFVAAEDDTFFKHTGISFVSILRAAIANLMAGHVVQGGSTITQQVAKSLFLTPDRNIVRKLKEVLIAYRLESNLTKQQILYIYLNQIYLGHGAHGVQAAARAYYHKNVSELTLAEMAILAGMPRAPGKFSPLLNPKRAKERQLYVLKRMFEVKAITENEYKKAAIMQVKLYPSEEQIKSEASYLIEHIRKHLIQRYGEKAVYEDGLKVHLAGSPRLYRVAQRALATGLRAADKRKGYRGPIKHLNTEDEIKKHNEDVLEALNKKLVTAVHLTNEGTLESLTKREINSEEFLEAVVLTSEPKSKTVKIQVAGEVGLMSAEDLNWAKEYLQKTPLTPGDVILCRWVKNDKEGKWYTLEQHPVIQGALLSVDLNSGAVLAMTGGYDFERSNFNRAIQAKRQPGSAFKPIIFSAALEKGFTAASVIVDAPIVYDDKEYGKWKPGNYEEKFYGDTTLREALIHSRNIPTIKMVQAIGVEYLIEYAKRLGFISEFNHDLSISLGSSVISLYELVQVYAAFGRQGRKFAPAFYTKVEGANGKTLEKIDSEQSTQPQMGADPIPSPSATVVSIDPTSGEPTPNPSPSVRMSGWSADAYSKDPNQVLDPRIAFIMTKLMREVVDFGSGRKAKSLGRPAAGKTGTTNDYKDAWFMGYTPNLLTGVWVGFDDSQSMGPGETGANAALPIWLEYMNEAVKNYPPVDFPVPAGVVHTYVDKRTGKLTGPRSPQAIQEVFIEGTIPVERSSNPSMESAPADSGEFLKED
ncbi:MAG: PBP1A family penicillin-binding protein [Xanthomonadaceae bacterium]|nr:PBP1A family penicillin-binding protein [Xanthomonadaceae bacterium]